MKYVVACSLCLAFFAACSASGPFTEPPPSDDIAIPTEASTVDHTLAEAGADAFGGPLFNGGGPFDCVNCICDGTIDMCVIGGGGGAQAQAPVLDAGLVDASDDASDDANDDDGGPLACVVPDAGQFSGCSAIPIGCLPKPTCGCLSQFFPKGCNCVVDESGSGYRIECPPNP